jgi:hypothetical protein
MDMGNQDEQPPARRHYPPLYEKAVPIALGIIALIVVVLLLVILGVALGLFPGAAY